MVFYVIMNVPLVVKLVLRRTTIKNKEIIISNVAEVGLEAQPLAKNNELDLNPDYLHAFAGFAAPFGAVGNAALSKVAVRPVLLKTWLALTSVNFDTS